jgi:hypothetical protein
MSPKAEVSRARNEASIHYLLSIRYLVWFAGRFPADRHFFSFFLTEVYIELIVFLQKVSRRE